MVHMRLRRLFATGTLILVLLLGVPTSALAVNVSANCTSSGGYFSTYGTADQWQDHYYGHAFELFRYAGRQYRSKGWGYVYGWQGGEVYGTRLVAGARCLI